MNNPSAAPRTDARRIFDAALAAVDPQEAVARHLKRCGDVLRVAERAYDLNTFRAVHVVGTGKAGAPMAKAVESILAERMAGGVVVVKYGHGARLSRVRILEAGHPVPDENSRRGAEAVLAQAAEAGPEDLVFCLVSGGGSSLLALPAEGLTLADKQAATRTLLACGAAIHEINTVRKHLSAVKGGRLARAAFPATVITLILSDVVGDDLAAIASGPTVPDSGTFADALGIIARHRISGRMPAAVLSHLEAGAAGRISETPKKGDDAFSRVQHVVVGRNLDGLAAARDRAAALGYQTLILSSRIRGEACHVAAVLAAVALEIRHSGHPIRPPACILCGGETTVTMASHGQGGRNQELALAAALEIANCEGILFLSAGSDGTDGPTAAAGAMVDGTTLARAKAAGLDARRHLHGHDAYPLFERLGDLVVTGPTRTNVMDLQVLLIDGQNGP
jgi:hydroxypyruvate reductase